MDLKQDYASSQPPRPIPPLGDNPDPEATTPGNGWLTAADECSLTGPHAQWLFTGVSELSVQNDFLIEYDMRTRAPIGIVHKKARRVMGDFTGRGGALTSRWLTGRADHSVPVTGRHSLDPDAPSPVGSASGSLTGARSGWSILRATSATGSRRRRWR